MGLRSKILKRIILNYYIECVPVKHVGASHILDEPIPDSGSV